MTTDQNADPVAIADAVLARKDPERFIKLSEVSESVGLSSSSIYRRLAAGTFPKARDLGGGVIRWRQGDIDDWKAARPLAAHKPTAVDPQAA